MAPAKGNNTPAPMKMAKNAEGEAEAGAWSVYLT